MKIKKILAGIGLTILVLALAFVWFGTYLPNDPAIPFADSSLDYFFLPKSMTVTDHYVRQSDTKKISDHYPLIAVIQLPK